MWSCDRRTLLAGLVSLPLILGACGFTPAYAPGESGSKLRDQILPDAPDDRFEYVFVDRLENRLGRSTAAPYRMSYAISTSTDGLAITGDQETLRYHLTAEATYKITDIASGQVLTTGRVETFTSYSAIGTTVATRASEQDATERVMIILADQIVTRLLATGDSWLP